MKLATENNSKLPVLWPIQQFDKKIEPHFLFIITPPHSGSTALAELLNTSNRTTFLQRKAEGQWLVPGMCTSDRWEFDKFINYNSVKSIWLNKYQAIRKLNKNIDVVIEKSPPNVIRIKELSSQFRSFSFIANNRNPYAMCASILYRNHDVDSLSVVKRIEILLLIAEKWIELSITMGDLIEELDVPLVTYESFCENPKAVINALKIPKGVVETINEDAIVNVKDYPPQKVINQNNRQVARLTYEEKGQLKNIFVRYSAVLSDFGYSIDW